MGLPLLQLSPPRIEGVVMHTDLGQVNYQLPQ